MLHGSAHVDQHGLQGIVTVSYKTYRNTYQISQYLSFVEKVYSYTPSLMSCSIPSRYQMCTNSEIANALVNDRALNTTSTYSVLLHCSVTDLKVII
jgi:hypothetical protein